MLRFHCLILMLIIGCSPSEDSNTPTPSGELPRAPFTIANPFPNGVVQGYPEDDGLDIMGDHLPVFALADGEIAYSEWGHTPWKTWPDTPNSVQIKLDKPIVWNGKKVVTLFYTHLSSLTYVQSAYDSPRRHVKAGEKLGVSGLGNQVPHLHLGMWLEGYGEKSGQYLDYLEIADLLGHYKQGEALK